MLCFTERRVPSGGHVLLEGRYIGGHVLLLEMSLLGYMFYRRAYLTG